MMWFVLLCVMPALFDASVLPRVRRLSSANKWPSHPKTMLVLRNILPSGVVVDIRHPCPAQCIDALLPVCQTSKLPTCDHLEQHCAQICRMQFVVGRDPSVVVEQQPKAAIEENPKYKEPGMKHPKTKLPGMSDSKPKGEQATEEEEEKETGASESEGKELDMKNPKHKLPGSRHPKTKLPGMSDAKPNPKEEDKEKEENEHEHEAEESEE